MLRTKIILPVAALVLVGGGLIGTGLVMAQDANPNQSLVQAIAQKFNLNQADVQAVFDSHNQQRQQQMQANLESRLNQAVSSGKITETQKTAILNKLSEMKNNHPDPAAFKNMTKEERQQTMEQKKADLENWAKQNGLTLETFHELVGNVMFVRKGPGEMGMGMKFTTPSP